MYCQKCDSLCFGLFCARCGAPILPGDPYMDSLRIVSKKHYGIIPVSEFLPICGNTPSAALRILGHLYESGILSPMTSGEGYYITASPQKIKEEASSYLWSRIEDAAVALQEEEKAFSKSLRRVSDQDVERELSLVDAMSNGHDFEYFVAKIIPYLGFEDVSVTPGSGDFGVDILATFQGSKVAIQCKRYSSPLGLSPVQEVFSGMSYYGCSVGAVITNTYFTDAAKTLAESTGVILLDRDSLFGAIQAWLLSYD